MRINGDKIYACGLAIMGILNTCPPDDCSQVLPLDLDAAVHTIPDFVVPFGVAATTAPWPQFETEATDACGTDDCRGSIVYSIWRVNCWSCTGAGGQWACSDGCGVPTEVTEGTID